jgi:hypothetical protein
MKFPTELQPEVVSSSWDVENSLRSAFHYFNIQKHFYHNVFFFQAIPAKMQFFFTNQQNVVILFLHLRYQIQSEENSLVCSFSQGR